MHTVFWDNQLAVGEVVALPPRERDHLFKVLRAAPGDRVDFLDGHGGRASGVVLTERRLCIDTVEIALEPVRKLHLYCALPRRAKFDVLLKQAAELGVWKITPLRCERSVSDGDSRERWTLLLREGCKQSKNPFVPQLGAPLKLSEALAEISAAGITGFYGEINGGATGERAAGDAAWLVGPEGGFTPEELSGLHTAGVVPLNLGPYVLRLETAAICGLAVLRRFIGAAVVALAGVVLLLGTAGCGDGEIAKNPLMLRGRNAASAGDAETARRMFQQLVARHPESPEAHLVLATLFDEALDNPGAALYHYDEYLRLAPVATDTGAVRRYRLGVRARLLRQLQREALPVPPADRLAAAEAQNAMMRRQINELKSRYQELRRTTVNRR